MSKVTTIMISIQWYKDQWQIYGSCQIHQLPLFLQPYFLCFGAKLPFIDAGLSLLLNFRAHISWLNHGVQMH